MNKKTQGRYEKTIHARIPEHLYEHLLRTAVDWALNKHDIDCAEWFVLELRARDYQYYKNEFETMRRNKQGFLKQFKGLPCATCGKPSNTVDHIVSLNKGGTNELSNLQPMCGPCNSKKSDGYSE